MWLGSAVGCMPVCVLLIIVFDALSPLVIFEAGDLRRQSLMWSQVCSWCGGVSVLIRTVTKELLSLTRMLQEEITRCHHLQDKETSEENLPC